MLLHTETQIVAKIGRTGIQKRYIQHATEKAKLMCKEIGGKV